jgi:hypothetical protein
MRLMRLRIGSYHAPAQHKQELGSREMQTPRFYYIDYGHQDTIATELYYSLSTLQAEGVDASGISIATDRPELFTGTRYDIIDIRDKKVAYIGSTEYSHRTKPAFTLDTLASREEPVVLLDTDTYFKPGFLSEVNAALKDGMGLNFFIRRNPYPGFGPFSMTLPSGIQYSYEADNSLMYNSGVFAVKREHAPIIADAIALIDGLWNAGLRANDIEQFAATEAFRLHHVTISAVEKSVHHYHSRWTRRYILWRLSHQPKTSFAELPIRRPFIRVNKTIVRLFRGYDLIKTLLRGDLKRFMRDAKIFQNFIK